MNFADVLHSPDNHTLSVTKPACSDSLLEALSSLLEAMCARNDHSQRTLTKFHSIAPASISILEYLKRLRRYAICSDSCFVIAIIYMDYAQQRSGLVVDSLNVHRILITTVMVATKFFDDKVQKNNIYAQIGGLSVEELNQLEIELLNHLRFSLNVPTDQYACYEQALLSRFRKSTSLPTFPVSTSTATTTALSPRNQVSDSLSTWKPFLAPSPKSSNSQSSSGCASPYSNSSEESTGFSESSLARTAREEPSLVACSVRE